MGQLDDFVIATETVEYGDLKLSVRGLGLQQITYIVRNHGETLSALYVQAVAGTLPASVTEIGFAFADDFAPLAGAIIACAAGDPKNAHVAAELPLAFQFTLLEKIVELTLVEAGGLGKLTEIVTKAAKATASLRPLKP